MPPRSSRTVVQRGSEAPPAERIVLDAGPLTMVFEPDGAFLRYVRLGETEILRGVYAAVRDHNWDTIPAKLTTLALERTPTSFRLTFAVDHRERGVDFGWEGELRGDADGTVRFTFSGEARSSFRRNRIGFCVLHPARCAGQPCTVEKVDGSLEIGVFPKHIAPHQPFQGVRAISHEVAAGVTAEVRFDGDVFEMEDQRNWTDASYKTYCTPLDLPFPVEVRAGTRIEQSVTITLSAQPPARDTGLEGPIVLQVDPLPEGGLATPVPRLGLGLASHGEPLTEREAERLRALDLAHLRVDLELFAPRFETVLERASEQARMLGIELEVAAFVSDEADDELAALAAATARADAKVARWLIFHRDEKSTRARWLTAARQHLAGHAPSAPIVGGTNAYFTELNRERPPLAAIDGVAYSINPQVHASDDASLIETLEAQRDTLASTRAFAPDVPIAVTPVTLKPRFNPNATGPEPEPAKGELPREVDPRQVSLFAAGWTLGSIKHLAEGGAASVTYFETTGWRGVMETEAGSRLPQAFRSSPGGVFPLYHVLADVGEFAAGGIVPSSSSAPLTAEALAVHEGGRTRILVANLSATTQQTQLVCPHLPATVWVRSLAALGAEEAIDEPERFRADPGLRQEVREGRMELCLSPYAIVRVDTVEGTKP